MRKQLEMTGKNKEDAIARALETLGMDRDDVSVEILELGKTGFLGIGSVPAKVLVTYEVPDEEPAPAPVESPKPPMEQKPAKPAQTPMEPKSAKPVPTPVEPKSAKPAQTPVEPKSEKSARTPMEPKPAAQSRSAKPAKASAPSKPEKSAPVEPKAEISPAVPADPSNGDVGERIIAFLTGLMAHMDMAAVPKVTQDGDTYNVVLEGEELGALIGRRGETLDAIQQLTSYAVNRGRAKRVRIHVDAENYRARREESLRRLAQKMAGKVVRYRRSITLEPMNAYERHVIHAALQDYPNVSTHSVGVEPNRRTVVQYDPGK